MLEHCVYPTTTERSDNVAVVAVNQQERVHGNVQSSETSTLPSKKFRVRDLAYIAGLLDGEGSIFPCKMQSGRYGVFVTIANTHRPVLEWTQELFGGTLIAGYGKNVPKNMKPIWRWKCAAEDVIPFLRIMAPFVRIKQKQLYKAMAIRACIEKGSQTQRIAKMAKQLSTLNWLREDKVHAT
jgi:hypothetical protein